MYECTTGLLAWSDSKRARRIPSSVWSVVLNFGPFWPHCNCGSRVCSTQKKSHRRFPRGITCGIRFRAFQQEHIYEIPQRAHNPLPQICYGRNDGQHRLVFPSLWFYCRFALNFGKRQRRSPHVSPLACPVHFGDHEIRHERVWSVLPLRQRLALAAVRSAAGIETAIEVCAHTCGLSFIVGMNRKAVVALK